MVTEKSDSPLDGHEVPEDSPAMSAFRDVVRVLYESLPPKATVSVYAADQGDGVSTVALFLRVPSRNLGRALGTMERLIDSPMISTLLAYQHEVRQRDTWVVAPGAKA